MLKPLQTITWEDDIPMSERQFDNFQLDMQDVAKSRLKEQFQDLDLDYDISWVTTITVKVYENK